MNYTPIALNTLILNSQKSKKSNKSPFLYCSPIVLDDEETLELDDIPTPQRLNNAYAEWLDTRNTKGVRQLAKEHRIEKSSLQDRIKGAKPKALEAQARQKLTVLEKLALKD
jgi:hypothetical protein